MIRSHWLPHNLKSISSSPSQESYSVTKVRRLRANRKSKVKSSTVEFWNKNQRQRRRWIRSLRMPIKLSHKSIKKFALLTNYWANKHLAPWTTKRIIQKISFFKMMQRKGRPFIWSWALCRERRRIIVWSLDKSSLRIRNYSNKNSIEYVAQKRTSRSRLSSTNKRRPHTFSVWIRYMTNLITQQIQSSAMLWNENRLESLWKKD